MKALIRKELLLYFSNFSGYLISCLFLLLTGLFLWVIPGHWNVFSVGHAHLGGLFELAPWLYLFLIPAVSMRLFADEYRLGTMELLLTSPLSLWEIVGAKYISGFCVVLLSLLPTLIFFYSINAMSSPPGNVDVGAAVGAYFGLVLLAGIYLAVGLFASSLVDSQIIAFLLTVFIAFLLYSGLDFFTLIFRGQWAYYVAGGSISTHYESVSKGVIRFSDFVYFGSVTGLFLFFTKLKIEP